MPNSLEDKQRVTARIRRIKGQCEGIEKAIEAGAGCGPILQQIAAARGAINGLMAEVLETHIREEFADPGDAGDGRTKELLSLVKTYLK